MDGYGCKEDGDDLPPVFSRGFFTQPTNAATTNASYRHQGGMPTGASSSQQASMKPPHSAGAPAAYPGTLSFAPASTGPTPASSATLQSPALKPKTKGTKKISSSSSFAKCSSSQVSTSSSSGSPSSSQSAGAKKKAKKTTKHRASASTATKSPSKPSSKRGSSTKPGAAPASPQKRTKLTGPKSLLTMPAPSSLYKKAEPVLSSSARSSQKRGSSRSSSSSTPRNGASQKPLSAGPKEESGAPPLKSPKCNGSRSSTSNGRRSSNRPCIQQRPSVDDDVQPLRLITLHTEREDVPEHLQGYYHEAIASRATAEFSQIDIWQLSFCFLTIILEDGITVFQQRTSKRNDIMDALEQLREAADPEQQMSEPTIKSLLRFMAQRDDIRTVDEAAAVQQADLDNLGNDDALFTLDPCGILFRATDTVEDEEDEDADGGMEQQLPEPLQPRPSEQTIEQLIESLNHAPVMFGLFKGFRRPATEVADVPLIQGSAVADLDTPPTIFPHQAQVGNRVFERISGTLQDLADKHGHPAAFEGLGGILIIVPNFNSLMAQTKSRAMSFFNHHGVDQGLVTIVKCHPNDGVRVKQFWEKVVEEAKKLFIVVHDEAHWAIDKSTARDSTKGLLDLFLNRPHDEQRRQREAKNVVRLLVTATPYALQTQKSRIVEEHEIHWDEITHGSEEQAGDQNGPRYFGLRDLRQSLNNQAQSRVVVDDEFAERAADYIGRGSKEARGQLIAKFTECYEAAFLLALNELGGIDVTPQHALALENRTTTPTVNMITSFLTATTNDDGKGHMLLIRVVNNVMGRTLTKNLTRLRKQLGLCQRFAILQDTSEDRLDRVLSSDEQTSRCLSRLERLHGTRNIKSYEQLEGLPCILVLCDKGRMGDTFPKSLQYYDLRLRYGSESTRAYMEQDLGRMFRYATGLSELPLCLLPPAAFGALQQSLTKLTPDARVRITRGKKEHVEMPRQHANEKESRRDSRYYRLRGRPTTKHYDEGFRGDPDKTRFLLQGKPQVGKTGAYLWALKRLADHVQPAEEDIVCCDDEEEEEEEDAIAASAETEEEASQRCGVLPQPTEIAKLKFRRAGRGKYGVPTRSAAQRADGEQGGDGLAGNAQINVDDMTGRRICSVRSAGPYNLKSRPDEIGEERRIRFQLGEPQGAEHTSLNIDRVLGSQWSIPNSKQHLFTGLAAFGGSGQDNGNTFRICVEQLDLPPIFMPSSGRAGSGLLDLSATMAPQEGERPLTWLHIIVVKQREFDNYCKHYPDVVVCALPDKASKRGIGASRDFIKCFATYNLETTREEAGEGAAELDQARFILMLDDSCLKFKRALVQQDPCTFADGCGLQQHHQQQQRSTSTLTANGSGDRRHVWRWDWQRRSQRTEYTMEDVRLRDVLQHMLSDPSLNAYALVGMARWHPFHSRAGSVYKRSHVYSFLLLNVEKARPVHYEPEDLLFEDIRFNNRLNDHELLFVKYNRFVLMKKQISTGGCSDLVERARSTLQEQQTLNLRFELRGWMRDDGTPVRFELQGIPKAEVESALEGNQRDLCTRMQSHVSTLSDARHIGAEVFSLADPYMLTAGEHVRHDVLWRVCIRPEESSGVRDRLQYATSYASSHGSRPLGALLRRLKDEGVLLSSREGQRPLEVGVGRDTVLERDQRDIPAGFHVRTNIGQATSSNVLVGYDTSPLWMQQLRGEWPSELLCATFDLTALAEDDRDYLVLDAKRRPPYSVFFYPNFGWVVFHTTSQEHQDATAQQ